MAEKILFIDNSNSFIVKTIAKNLEKQNLNCDICELSLKELESRKEEMGKYVFLYIGDRVEFDMMALNYLKDLCLEDDHVIYFCGYEEDIKSITDVVCFDTKAGEFYRPLNVAQVSEQMIKIIRNNEDSAPKKHILVVDDSGTMLTTIRTWLSGKYRVSLVNSAMNALTFLTKQKPDLVLLDYDMPVCSGAHLLEMMRSEETTADIPVIFLTGKGDKDSVKSVLDYKPAGYLLKTLPKEKIIDEIDTFFLNREITDIL